MVCLTSVLCCLDTRKSQKMGKIILLSLVFGTVKYLFTQDFFTSNLHKTIPISYKTPINIRNSQKGAISRGNLSNKFHEHYCFCPIELFKISGSSDHIQKVNIFPVAYYLFIHGATGWKTTQTCVIKNLFGEDY